MNTDTFVIFLIFRIYRIILDDNGMMNVNHFKWQKLSLRVLLSICLILWQFQSGVAYKNAAYKKNV